MKQENAYTHNVDLIEKSLSDFLSCVPDLTISRALLTPENSSRVYRPDLILSVTLPPEEEKNSKGRAVSRTWRLVVEAVRYTSPSLLEPALAMLTQYVARAAEPARAGVSPLVLVPVLFAPYLSPTAIDRCTEAGVNCVDTAGNGRIILGTRTYIERTGQPDPTPRQESIARLFVPKAERVLRVLLNADGAMYQTWRIQPLAEEASVSIGQVARVKAALQERGFITEVSTVRRNGGFHLIHPEELLQEWAASVRTTRYRVGVDHTYNAVDSVMELKRMLSRKVPRRQDAVALSGLMAADRYAPYVVSPRLTAYVVEKDDVRLKLIEEALDLKPVDRGINVVLTIPRDEGVLYLPADIKADFADSPESPQTVSPIQTYLDLQRLGGRAQEGAQHLLETYLRPRWQREAQTGTKK
jgi:hypothetical protein